MKQQVVEAWLLWVKLGVVNRDLQWSVVLIPVWALVVPAALAASACGGLPLPCLFRERSPTDYFVDEGHCGSTEGVQCIVSHAGEILIYLLYVGVGTLFGKTTLSF